MILRIAVADQVQAGGWIEVQRAAGTIGDEWRPSFGTWCTASDGHRCRSVFERHVDDFFSRSNIAHQIEPDYPYDPELNRTGLRADWVLSDGSLVEAAGMLNSPEYSAKIEAKQELARRHNLNLIIVTPAHLRDLRVVFREQLQPQ